jgi:histidine ammonia-lyase
MVAATQGNAEMNALTLIPGQLSLSQLRRLASRETTLDEGAFAAINDSVACVANAIVAEGRTAYGINTGFGLLAQTRIATGSGKPAAFAGAVPCGGRRRAAG